MLAGEPDFVVNGLTHGVNQLLRIGANRRVRIGSEGQGVFIPSRHNYTFGDYLGFRVEFQQKSQNVCLNILVGHLVDLDSFSTKGEKDQDKLALVRDVPGHWIPTMSILCNETNPLLCSIPKGMFKAHKDFVEVPEAHRLDSILSLIGQFRNELDAVLFEDSKRQSHDHFLCQEDLIFRVNLDYFSRIVDLGDLVVQVNLFWGGFRKDTLDKVRKSSFNIQNRLIYIYDIQPFSTQVLQISTFKKSSVVGGPHSEINCCSMVLDFSEVMVKNILNASLLSLFFLNFSTYFCHNFISLVDCCLAELSTTRIND